MSAAALYRSMGLKSRTIGRGRTGRCLSRCRYRARRCGVGGSIFKSIWGSRVRSDSCTLAMMVRRHAPRMLRLVWSVRRSQPCHAPPAGHDKTHTPPAPRGPARYATRDDGTTGGSPRWRTPPATQSPLAPRGPASPAWSFAHVAPTAASRPLSRPAAALQAAANRPPSNRSVPAAPP